MTTTIRELEKANLGSGTICRQNFEQNRYAKALSKLGQSGYEKFGSLSQAHVRIVSSDLLLSSLSMIQPSSAAAERVLNNAFGAS